MSTPARSPSARQILPTFRRNLWLLLGACLLIFTAIGVQTLLLNLFLVTLGYRADFLGYFTFANTAGIGGAALLAGRVTNLLNSRRTLIGSTVVLAISSVLIVVLTQPLPLLILAVVNGASLAHVFVPCATFVMDNAEPNQRSTAYAGYFTAQSLAMVVGSLVGGALPGLLVVDPSAVPFGYGVTLVVAGLVAGLGVAPLFLADDKVATGSTAFQGATASQRDQSHAVRRNVLWLTATNGITATALGFGVPFLNVYFAEQLGVSTGDVGLIFALGSAAMVVASISGPWAAVRLGAVPTIVAFRLLTAPIFVGLGLAGTVQLAATLYVARTLFTNVTWPVDNAFSMELVPPQMRSTMAGLRSASWNLAWAVSSAIAGQMIVSLGFLPIFIAAAIFMALGALAYLRAFGSSTPEPAPVPVASASE